MTNNFKKTSRFGLSSSAVALSMVLAAPAFAQGKAAPADEAADESVIVVTGSLIKNPNLSQATPVNVTTADTIELKQNNNAEQLLREIPGIVPSIGSAVNNGNGGASFVNLRGLGSNRNIVLLDGVRLVPAELNGRFDLNNVPLALLQRVEVLTGGASTTYGADAISGVVNFITRKDFTGVEAQASEQITERGDGNVFRVDVTMGANFDDGRGNAVFSIGYQQTDPVYQGGRPFSFTQISSFTGGPSGSGTSIPSRFTNVNPTGGNFCAIAIAGVCGPTVQGTRPVLADGSAFQTTAATAAQGFNFNPYNIFQTPFERFNMYGAANYDVSDALNVYTRGIFSKNTVNTIIAPSGAFNIPVTINLNNPYLTTAMRNALCAFDTNVFPTGTINPATGLPYPPGTIDPTGAIYSPRFTPAQCAAAANPALRPGDAGYQTVSTSVSRRAVEVGPRISQFTTTFFDYRLGAGGGITDSISWDLWGSYGESENIQTQKGYTLNSRITQALLANNTTSCFNTANSCVPLNLFGTITPAMIPFISGTSQISVKTTMSQVHGGFSGDFGGFASPFATDAVQFAVAGEYRKYKATQFSDALSKAGDLGGSGGAAPDINGGYHVYEAIGELVVPLVQDKPFFDSLELKGGVRYSDYTVDTVGSPSYNATTYKGEVSWTPVKAIKLRGNYSHAVRAPNVAELFSPVNTTLTNLATDPCQGAAPVTNANLRAVCLAQGATAAQIGAIIAPSAGQINTTGGGNINLKPEKSNSYGFGVVLQPSNLISNLSLSVDYYNIKITGAITSPTVGDAISSCFGNLSAASASSAACTVIRRNPATGGLDGPANTTPGVFQSLSNLGVLHTAGIDATLNWSYDFDFAKFSLAANGNWTDYQKFQAVAGVGTNRDCVGYYSTNCGSLQPKWATTVRGTLAFEPGIDVSLLWRHLDSMQQEPDDILNGNGPACGPGNQAGSCAGKNFQKIKAYDYFDLSTRFGLTDNVTLTLTVTNLFDKKPPILGNTVGSTTYNSGNTYPSTYDALGRRYAAGVKLKF